MWHAWEGGETCKGFWWEISQAKGHLKDQGVDGRMMGSKWTSGRLVVGCVVDSSGSEYGLVAGCCECGDEPLCSGATESVN
jgi:hypothetical protein